jgi:hypothetical protein
MTSLLKRQTVNLKQARRWLCLMSGIMNYWFIISRITATGFIYFWLYLFVCYFYLFMYKYNVSPRDFAGKHGKPIYDFIFNFTSNYEFMSYLLTVLIAICLKIMSSWVWSWRGTEVKFDGMFENTLHDFLFVFNNKYGCIVHCLGFISIGNTSDLESDLERSQS